MKTQSDTVEKLTELLDKLKVIEDEVRNLIAAEGGESQVEGATSVRTVRNKGSKPLFPGEEVVLNDRVKINNPNKDQQQKGRVIGRTGKGRLGFLRIITPNGNEVRRIGKNVTVLTESEYHVLPEYRS